MTKLDAKIQQIQEEKKSQQEKATTPIIDVLEKIQQKTFTNNQEARRFYGALKVLLPTITKKKIRVRGWVCSGMDDKTVRDSSQVISAGVKPPSLQPSVTNEIILNNERYSILKPIATS